MSKKIFSLLLTLVLLLGLFIPVCSAEDLGGTVSFNGTRLISNYSSASLSGVIGAIQPGDDGIIEITLKNNHSKSTDWWVKNDIIKNFLDSETGGAYTYRLSFLAPGEGETILYDSDRVGGANLKGLREVNDALKDYMYLGTLASGSTGTLRVYIQLDGETHGNAYKNSLARLKLNFAVEDTQRNVIVKTGDETNKLPYLTAAAISGALLLLMAVIQLEKEQKKRKGAV